MSASNPGAPAIAIPNASSNSMIGVDSGQLVGHLLDVGLAVGPVASANSGALYDVISLT